MPCLSLEQPYPQRISALHPARSRGTSVMSDAGMDAQDPSVQVKGITEASAAQKCTASGNHTCTVLPSWPSVTLETGLSDNAQRSPVRQPASIWQSCSGKNCPRCWAREATAGKAAAGQTALLWASSELVCEHALNAAARLQPTELGPARTPVLQFRKACWVRRTPLPHHKGGRRHLKGRWRSS